MSNFPVTLSSNRAPTAISKSHSVTAKFAYAVPCIPSIPTETPEEKEALDAIEQVEWNGEGLPPVGVECECFNYDADLWMRVITLDAKTESGEIAVSSINENGKYARLFWGCKFRKPETPEQRKEREELEAAYDLYCEFRSERNLTVCSIENLHKESGFEFIMHFVRKTGHRKGE